MYVLDDELILADIKSNDINSTIYVLNSTWTKVSNIPEDSICSKPLDCELVVTKSNDLKTFYLFRESFVNFYKLFVYYLRKWLRHNLLGKDFNVVWDEKDLRKHLYISVQNSTFGQERVLLL